MKTIIKFPIHVIGALLAFSTAFAGEHVVRQDSKALDVLKTMSTYKASLERVVIQAVSFTDARLGNGLLIVYGMEMNYYAQSMGKTNAIST